MKDIVCNFAPLRFLPYRETGEFVNVGVVVQCPQIDYFDFLVTPLRKTGRITGFFPELDIKLFKAALKGARRELARVKGAHGIFPTADGLPEPLAKEKLEVFRELVRRREGLLHFGEAGMLLAEAPEKALTQLFDRYVERQFAHKREYREIAMRDRLAACLKKWNVAPYYENNGRIGDQDFHVVMPFVHYSGSTPTKVLKPLDLDKTETSDIYHHGGVWVKNMERLKGRQSLPAEVYFTVKMPPKGKQREAATEICAEFGNLGVEAIPFGDIQRIREVTVIPVEDRPRVAA